MHGWHRWKVCVWPVWTPPPADAARLLRDFVHTQRLKLTRATAEALEDAVAEQMEGGATTTPRPIGGADSGNAGGDAGQEDASRQDEGQEEEEEEEDRPAASPRAAAAEQQSRVAWEAAAVRLPLLLLPDTSLKTSVFDGCDLLTGLLFVRRRRYGAGCGPRHYPAGCSPLPAGWTRR